MTTGIEELLCGAGLAPMAGVSDAAMRRVCARFGAAFTVSEMVSAKALTMGPKAGEKSMALLRGGGGRAPYGVQLFGHEPGVLAQAIMLIEGENYNFLDINMGCPAPKVCNHGDGSGLLLNPALAGQMAKAAVESAARPVTVKLRTGWDSNNMTGLEVAQRCEAAGVRLLVVHARTRAQQYTPGVDYAAVAAIKKAVKIPVLFNGDVNSPGAAQTAMERTGCDGVVVGRAAVGDPFLFEGIKAALSGRLPPQPPTLRRRFEVMDWQVREMCGQKGEARAMREARKVAAGYMKGLAGAAVLRRAALALTYYTDLAALTELAYRYNTQRR